MSPLDPESCFERAGTADTNLFNTRYRILGDIFFFLHRTLQRRLFSRFAIRYYAKARRAAEDTFSPSRVPQSLIDVCERRLQILRASSRGTKRD